MAVLQGSQFERRVPYRCPCSCHAFELGSAEPGHSVQDADTYGGLGSLVGEGPRLQFRPYHRLPATHLGLDQRALIVAAGFLPTHSALGCDRFDMPVPRGRIVRRVGARDSVLRRRDDDHHLVTKPRFDKIADGCPVIGAVGDEQGDWRADLAQKFRKRCGVADTFWPAAGFVDTEIRCLTELESGNAEKEVQPRVQA